MSFSLVLNSWPGSPDWAIKAPICSRVTCGGTTSAIIDALEKSIPGSVSLIASLAYANELSGDQFLLVKNSPLN